MKTATLLVVAALALPPGPSRAQVTDYEAPGNLQARTPVGCVALSKVTNQETPADLYPGVAACVRSGDYHKGAMLFAVAGTFAYFDQLRVADSSARQAAMAIEMKEFSSLTMDERQSFMKVLSATLDANSPGFKAVCTAVAQQGPPRYFPAYMVQHGMSAFLGGSGSGVQADFDSAQGWRQALSGFLHCP